MTKRRIPRRAGHEAGQQNLGLLRYLLRGETGFVHLMSTPSARYGDDEPSPVTMMIGKRRYRGAFPLEILQNFDSLLPEVREHLTLQLRPDGRASINTAYFPKPSPNKEGFYRLNAVWLDLDCSELPYKEAFARVARLVADDVLPPFSIVTNTGNGLHVLWGLRGDEKEPDSPPRAFRQNRTLQADINRALVERVRAVQPDLQPDPSPVHVTTHTRVPGSVNSRTNSQVVMTVNITSDGFPPYYTLDELREFLHVPVRESTRRAGGTKRPDGTPPDPIKLRAHLRRFEVLLDELEALRAHRGGFSGGDARKPKKRKKKYQLQSLKPALSPGVPQNVEPEEQPSGATPATLPAGSVGTSGRIHGHRRHAVYLMATFMKKLKRPPEDIYRAAEQLARECRPPLPQSEAIAAAKSGMAPRGKPPRNTTIAERLGVTVEEANFLGLESIRPDFESKAATSGGMKGRKLMGLAVLQQLVQKYGPTLPHTFESLRQELQTRHGLNPSRGTIGHWLTEVGAQVLGHRGKYKQPSQQTDLLALPGTGDGPVN